MKRFVSSFLAVTLCLTPALMVNVGAISKEQIRDHAEKAWNNTKYGAGKAWNGTKYGAEKAYNGTAWGLGKTWNGTKYCAGKAYNGTAWGLGKAWNGTKYYGGKIKKAIEDDLSATPIPRPTSIPEVTPTPTSTPEWSLTPEITPESTPEVVQVAQIEGEL